VIHEGCYIDNSAGVYTSVEIIERLAFLVHDVGGTLGTSLEIDMNELQAMEDSGGDPDMLDFAHEIEEDLIDLINDNLAEHLVMTVGEVDPGVYVIRELDEENEL
jgi:hypothetical protein